jgi:hypothetical protein
MSSEAINFDSLVQVIQQTHASFASQASKAVNISLTLRNWFIGHHIAEFELHGADRAGFGDGLLDALSRALRSRQVNNTGRRQLYGYLRFYRSYPQIVRTASALLLGLLVPGMQYTLASMTNKLFVSRYQLALPAASEMEAFLRRALGELGVGDGGAGV